MMKIKHTRRRFILLLIVVFAVLSAIPLYAETIENIYDDLNRLTKTSDQDGRITEYVYDEVGNRMEKSSFNPHIIVATVVGNGIISPAGNVPAKHKYDQTFTITPNQYYHIADVKVDGASVGPINSYTFQSVTANHTIQAQFAIYTYALNVNIYDVALQNSAGGVVTSNQGGISCGAICSAIYNNGTQVTLTATPNIAYTFKEWSGACTGSATTCIVATNSPKSVTANFEKKSFTITASGNPDENGISPSGTIKIYYGDSMTFAIGSDIGYTTANVKINGTFVGAKSPHTFSNITANQTIEAIFSCPAKPIMKGSVGYDSLQEAYNNAANNETIKIHAMPLPAGLITSSENKSVTIEGGYTCGYNASSAMTSIKGSIQTTPGGGTLTIKNIILKSQ